MHLEHFLRSCRASHILFWSLGSKESKASIGLQISVETKKLWLTKASNTGVGSEIEAFSTTKMWQL